ncbi:hypothetical protein [Actinoalloteichus hymeniacidonis]|uniref:hypothetical protein n=1 Tax=Actinoalloteichus hymeniacidonis TaxID=340345 RepID=UPI0012FCD0C2|nr:hypothetical protein [Actinoalloteichus hymeniacidonis]MBB5907277.1 hypothetical protein [Actinoalloteichus hymeniacidonis]
MAEERWREHLEDIDDPTRAEACYEEGWDQPRCGRYLAGVVRDVLSVSDAASATEWPQLAEAAESMVGSYEEYEAQGCHESESANCSGLRTEVLLGPSLVLVGYAADQI